MMKILFNDNFLLTQAVLDGRKTQTRRVITYPKTFHGKDVRGYYVCRRATDGAITEVCMYDEDESFIDEGQIFPKYNVGEVVAVAQSYKDVDAFYSAALNRKHSVHGMTIGLLDCVPDEDIKKWFGFRELFVKKASWKNKMFVKAELMPHQIYITDVRVERLQDISGEDCLKEGITDMGAGSSLRYSFTENVKQTAGDIIPFSNNFATAQEAFANLINKVSRKDVWSENPYVFVYDFELVR